MRIPPLHEAQAHLAGAGWRLLPQTSEKGQIHDLKLLHRNGNLVEEFPDLLRFWLYWLDFAAYTLSHHRCVDVVVTTYQRGSGRRREALIRDLETYLTRTDRSGIERLVGRVGCVSPVALPRNWKSELISILNGPYPKPNFCITVVDALIELDPKLGERWGTWSVCIPVLQPCVPQSHKRRQPRLHTLTHTQTQIDSLSRPGPLTAASRPRRAP